MPRDNLIYGINPLVISSIKYSEGFRSGGVHPYAETLFARKHPILSALGFGPATMLFDGWHYPTLFIYIGGREARSITFKSNEACVIAWEQALDELNEFLSDIRRNDIDIPPK